MTTISDTPTTTISPAEMRQRNPAAVLPKAFSGIGQLLAAAGEGGVPRSTLELVGLRVSQINGCTACVQGHVEEARAAGASDEQIFTVAAWIDSPYFDEDQRVALALADSLTRMADRSDDPVPDDLWAAVTARYDERQVSAILLQIGTLNMFNRLNVAVKEQADRPSWRQR
jgi:AhpD family alkylhydroperoxidase